MPINEITMGSSLGSEYANRVLLGHSYSRGFISSVDGPPGSLTTVDFTIDFVGMFLFDGNSTGLNAGTVTVNDSLLPWSENKKYYHNDYELVPAPPFNYNLLNQVKIKATGSASISTFDLAIMKPLCDTISLEEPKIEYERAKGIQIKFNQPITGADSAHVYISTSNKLLQEKATRKLVPYGSTTITFSAAELNGLYADSSASLSINAFKNHFPADIATRKTHVLGVRSSHYLIILK